MNKTTCETALPPVWLTHRVSYGETDTMGVLYYAEYLHIFERGRNALIRAHGFSYNDVEARGLYLPVREAQCRYRSPARYDDLLALETSIPDFGRASITFAYRLFDESRERLLAEGFTQHACVDGTGRPGRTPGWFREMFHGGPAL